MMAHIGYAIDGQSFVTPTSFWRTRDTLYWHGSRASRMIHLEKGVLVDDPADAH